MNDVDSSYRKKLRTAEQIVSKVKSGDHIFYGEFVLRPEALDAALARRAPELTDVIVDGVCVAETPQFIEADPGREHFIFDDWHLSAASRKLSAQGLCNYIPLDYNQGPRIVRKYKNYDFVFVNARPMDAQGYFNFGLVNSMTSAAIIKGKKVVVETNESLPHCLGGNQESVHISRVDYIVEGPNTPLPDIQPQKFSKIDWQIGEHIIKEIEDGACLQLGIGGLPNVIGSMIAQSDLKDLGIHTEMFSDCIVDLCNEGKITGNGKTMDRFKMVYTFGMGTKKLYEFLHHNPACASYPVNYTNDPKIIGLNARVVAINNAIEIDLFSQVSSESVGTAQITGTGGQLDFILGAFASRRGKGIIGMSSTFTDAEGKVHSRIVPTLRPGSVVTTPRSIVQYVATEYGIVQLKGKATWARAAALINIAHPMFRDELIRQAREMNIWINRHRRDADQILA